MKTIEQIWKEYVIQHTLLFRALPNMERYMRDAFYAGFNRTYCAVLDSVCEVEGPHSVFCIPQYEKEMDDHRESLDNE